MGIYCCQMVRSNATIQNEGTFVTWQKLRECIDQIGYFRQIMSYIFYKRLKKVLLQRVTYLSQNSECSKWPIRIFAECICWWKTEENYLVIVIKYFSGNTKQYGQIILVHKYVSVHSLNKFV